MATKDRTTLKDEFKNGNLATGERFADLIDSMKVVQLPVVDPQALGTSLSFIDSISQDEDGKITATKKTLDLANAHELNPFKGWYKTGDILPTDGFDGAYLYFKDTTEQTGLTTIYRWNGTAYADTGTVVDTSNVQTFETGQAVNGVAIDGTGLENPATNALAKGSDVRVIKSALGTDNFTEVALLPTTISDSGKYISPYGLEGSENGWQYATFDVSAVKRVRFIGYVKAGNPPSVSGYCFYDANNTFVCGMQYDVDGSLTTGSVKEYTVDVPIGATVLKTNIKGVGGLTDAFYCYAQNGENLISKNRILRLPINYTIDNKYILYNPSSSQNGTLIDDNGFATSKPIYLEKGMRIVVHTSAKGIMAIALTDAQGSSYTIVRGTPSTSTHSSYQEYVYEATQNCYVASSIMKSKYGECYYEVRANYGFAPVGVDGLIPDKYLPTVDIPVSGMLPTMVKSYPFNIPGFVRKADGYVRKTTSTGICTELIEINDNAEYDISGVYGANTAIVAFYDENKGFISAWDDTGITENPVNLKISKSDGIPATARYMRVSGNTTIAGCHCWSSLDEVEHNKKLISIPITTLAQYATNSGGLNIAGGINLQRVSFECTYIVPYLGATLLFKLPPFVTAWVYSGDKPYAQKIAFSSSNGWFANGDRFKLPDTSIYFRVVFAKSNYIPNNFTPSAPSDRAYDNLSVEQVNQYVMSGELAIYYEDDSSVIEDNKSCEKYVKGMMRRFGDITNDGDLHSMPIFAHATDNHGDVVRTKRFLEYAKYLEVDAALDTGDIVAYYGGDGMSFLNMLTKKIGVVTLPCIGNHDVGIQSSNVTAEDQYNNITKFYIDEFSLQTNTLEPYPTYYYLDIASKNIRLIVLNCYEAGRYLASDSYAYFSQRQIDWLIATLGSTPAGYGVILVYHADETMPVKGENEKDGTFYQENRVATPGTLYGISGNPISKIIDTFISGGQLNTTFSETNSMGNSVTVNIDADFSNKNTGVEFIAHVTGHAHIDQIGYYAGTTNTQLVLNLTTLCSQYGQTTKALANASDLPRGGKGVSQDAFNIYVIDRESKTIKIARVGSNINYDGRKRDWMIIPYSN